MYKQFYIAGFKFHEGMLKLNDINEGDKVLLIPEPDNPYDENAIRIEYHDSQLGYVPKAVNQNILPAFEEQPQLIGRITEVNKDTAFDEPWKAVKVHTATAEEGEEA